MSLVRQVVKTRCLYYLNFTTVSLLRASTHRLINTHTCVVPMCRERVQSVSTSVGFGVVCLHIQKVSPHLGRTGLERGARVYVCIFVCLSTVCAEKKRSHHTWVMPISRETRVRRDGFSNSASSVRCFNASVYAWGSFFIFKARSMTLTI